MVIGHWVVMNSNVAARDNVLLPVADATGPEQLYRDAGCTYPKFFKMDMLCKWAFMATEYLLGHSDSLYKDIDKNKIAIVLSTSHGCIDVDKRYKDSLPMASPALFVYTLPNIMLGEICIRHGFKGEQLCMVSEQFDAEELYLSAQDLITNKGMEACLCGWVDVTGDHHDLCMFWVTKRKDGLAFAPAIMQELYQWQDFKVK